MLSRTSPVAEALLGQGSALARGLTPKAPLHIAGTGRDRLSDYRLAADRETFGRDYSPLTSSHVPGMHRGSLARREGLGA